MYSFDDGVKKLTDPSSIQQVLIVISDTVQQYLVHRRLYEGQLQKFP